MDLLRSHGRARVEVKERLVGCRAVRERRARGSCAGRGDVPDDGEARQRSEHMTAGRRGSTLMFLVCSSHHPNPL